MSRKETILDRILIPSPCPAEWDSMTGNRRQRFCQECNKTVYNLSAMTREEAEALVARFAGRLCARVERDTSGVTISEAMRTAPQLVSRRASPVAAALMSTVIGLGGNVMATTLGANAPAAIQSASEQPDRGPQPRGETATTSGENARTETPQAPNKQTVVLAGAVRIREQPLRPLYDQSDLILVARLGRSVTVKTTERNDMQKTTLEVAAVVKGGSRRAKVTVYNWGWGEDKQFPGGLKRGDTALFFLKQREGGDGFEVSDYSFGVKKLAPADLSIYENGSKCPAACGGDG